MVAHRSPAGYALEVQTKSHFGGGSISLSTLAHEIAHQWFGDSVGPATGACCGSTRAGRPGGPGTGATSRTAARPHGRAAVHDATTTRRRSRRAGTPPRRVPDAALRCSRRSRTTPAPAMMLEAYRQIVGDPAFFAFQRSAGRRARRPDDHDAAVHRAGQADRARPRRLHGVEPGQARHVLPAVARTAGRPALNPTTFFQSTSETGTVTGTVPATLSLSMGARGELRRVQPGRRARLQRVARSPT